MHAPTDVSRLSCERYHTLRVVEANEDSLRGYGLAVRDYNAAQIEIVRWPKGGWRPVDPDTGDQGGTVEGLFEFWWEDGTLFGKNHAVNDSYLMGWTKAPGNSEAPPSLDHDRSNLWIWHANYHPDGGQLFFPRENKPFLMALALPGDDIAPDQFTAFYCDGSFGLYIHPGVWHEGAFPLSDRATFLDKQGVVHARVSCNFLEEFELSLHIPLKPLV